MASRRSTSSLRVQPAATAAASSASTRSSSAVNVTWRRGTGAAVRAANVRVSGSSVEAMISPLEAPVRAASSRSNYGYDLADRRGRVAAYQRVMTEGLGEDVLHFVDVDRVVDMWDELHLSLHIRALWERWLLDSDLRVQSAAEEAIRRLGEAPRRLGD